MPINTFDRDENKSSGQYQCGCYYTMAGVPRQNVHIFTTDVRTKQRLVPLISPTKREALSKMNPNSSVAAATSVIAKINGNVFSGGPIGINYEGSKGFLYISASQYKAAPADSYSYPIIKYSPSFCVKTDGTATIRWFSSANLLQQAMNACDCIIAAAHALVFGGQCVPDTAVWDHETGNDHRLIYDPSLTAAQQSDTRYDFSPNYSDPKGTSTAKRTCLGHVSGSNGKYVLVCADGGMTIKEAAQLMKKLGCDYAVNLDGAISTQMRIKNGYGANGLVTTAENPVYAGVAVCTV